jgi:precorrin-2/cobalt-factor-2 C20-methyltransferase
MDMTTTITIDSTEETGMKWGTFYGVGVGPGDPELLTLKAARILTEVDWIFCPCDAGRGTSFAASILTPLGLPAGKFRSVSLCMSRERGPSRPTYDRAAEEIVAELRRGHSAAWITEGDPLFYSTFLYVHEALRRYPEVKTEIIPGVTSVQAAAARVGVAVAHLDERLAVLPGAYGLERLPALLEQCATVILVKINSVFDELLDRLARTPGPIQAFYLEKVGTAEERVVTDLPALRGQKLPYFSLVILRRGEGREP